MEWILNDLSLKNKYATATDFFSDIEEIIKLRSSNRLINDNLMCPRSIGDIEVVNKKKFSQVVFTEAPRDLKQQIITWANKNGPFWCDRKTENENDYFEYNGIDVTDSGLGECARKSVISQSVSSYSFSGLYDSSPLPVQHGLPEDVIGTYDIDNLWTTDQLIESCRGAIPEPTNWGEAIEQLRDTYQKLIFSTCLLEQISTLPFNLTVLLRMKELCRVLEDYLASRNKEGEMTPKSHEILEQHFHGDKAWFSDESDDDARKFEKQLNFIDTRDDKKKLYRFHGKIKTPQVRVYFEWPIQPEQKDIQVVYFGPKITKK
jgi:hypothetical protein